MTKPRHILVTGAAGFIGSNFVRIALENNYYVTGLDSLTYAGQRSTINHLKRLDKFRFCHDDIGNKNLLASVLSNGHQAKLCGVVNFAAETHVDRSIEDPSLFYETNVFGTHNLIQCLIKSDVCSHDFRFVQIILVHFSSQRNLSLLQSLERFKIRVCRYMAMGSRCGIGCMLKTIVTQF